jgi:hypothetical protein
MDWDMGDEHITGAGHHNKTSERASDDEPKV